MGVWDLGLYGFKAWSLKGVEGSRLRAEESDLVLRHEGLKSRVSGSGCRVYLGFRV